MFGRKKDQSTVTTRPAESASDRPGAKNRPTPKRREAEAARRAPLVPADRKAAAAQSKQADREARVKRQQAMRRGEEWALLPRDRGEQRAYVRDVVDSRWNIGEFLLPVIVIGLPLTFFDPTSAIVRIGFAIVYGAFAVFILDTFVMWFQLRRRIARKFGGKPAQGAFFYAMSRTLSMRRTRMPLPRVKRGQKVD